MSGHSKWATTKRQKALVDAKKGTIFTKIGNLITIAARKGEDPENNFSLRMAMDKARAVNMPKENIERAIKRGTGELAGEQIEELIYEGFGPSKSQFIIKCLTGNKNRSAALVRHIFSKYGGSLSQVAWNFEQKGVIRIINEELKFKKLDNENFELELIDAGAEDILHEPEGLTIYTRIEDLQKVKHLLDKRGVATTAAEIEYVSKQEQNLSQQEKEQVEKFIGELESNEDVSDYYSNVNL